MRRRGFTLLELLIALAVLAIVSLAVFGRGGDVVRGLYTMEQRTLARWVAENEVSKLYLERIHKTDPVPLGARRNRVTLGDRTWQVVRRIQATSHPALRRVEVSVYAVEEGTEVGPVDVLTAFVGRY